MRPRLPGHNYSGPGVYFVTCCIRDRLDLLADSYEDEFVLNRLGRIVGSCWKDLPLHYPLVRLDRMVIMPNHLHGILIFKAPTSSTSHDLFEVMRALKSFSARRINEMRGSPGTTVWQRGFYHSVVTDRVALQRIRNYILLNPVRWRRRLNLVVHPGGSHTGGSQTRPHN